MVRRQRRGTPAPLPAGGRGGRTDSAQPEQAARLLSASVQSQRRRALRGPYFHLHAEQGRRGADQQLDGARRRLTARCADGSTVRCAGARCTSFPTSWGPLDSPFAKVGVELTDSIYVALNMGLMTRMGAVALAVLGSSDDFNRGLHSHAGLRSANAASYAIFRRTIRSGRPAAATVATRCSARNASRCASRAGSATRKAGWPSTC